LEKALDDHLHKNILSDGTEPTLQEPNFPSLQDQSQLWSLNKQQLDAFLFRNVTAHSFHQKTSGKRKEFKYNIENQETRLVFRWLFPTNRHLVMFLAGSGGMGKSRIIKCSKDFTLPWHSVAATIICASSGVAAMLIEGCTLLAALGNGVRMHPPHPTLDQISAWSEVGILIIDEFSMVTPQMLSLLDERLRRLNGKPNKLFGGIHIVFCGDFFQLPPVGSGPI
jgi:hypothetical protein